MSEQTPEPDLDPDADPQMMHPRDLIDEQPYDGDPDADPGNLNPPAPQEPPD